MCSHGMNLIEMINFLVCSKSTIYVTASCLYAAFPDKKKKLIGDKPKDPRHFNRFARLRHDFHEKVISWIKKEIL